MSTKFGHSSIYTFRDIKLLKKFMLPEKEYLCFASGKTTRGSEEPVIAHLAYSCQDKNDIKNFCSYRTGNETQDLVEICSEVSEKKFP